jgi:hypothetical protein
MSEEDATMADVQLSTPSDATEQPAGPPAVEAVPRFEQFSSVQPRDSSSFVRLPDFWVSNPNMWFAQAEAAFRRGGVFSSIVRYDYTLMKLPEEVLKTVQDLVTSVQDDTPDAYERLKFRQALGSGNGSWLARLLITRWPATPDLRRCLTACCHSFRQGSSRACCLWRTICASFQRTSGIIFAAAPTATCVRWPFSPTNFGTAEADCQATF